MLRRTALFALVTILSAAGAHPFLSARIAFSSSTIAQGEFWRLPWAAGTSLQISGNGYGEDTHHDINSHALDFGVRGAAIEGKDVLAVQEGTVTASDSKYQPWQCSPDYLGGNYVEIRDVGGFVSHYAHLRVVYKGVNDYVEPGWIIGQAGHTGWVEPCTNDPNNDNTLGSHLHFRITGCSGDNCIPEPMSDQCAAWPTAYPDRNIAITCGQMDGVDEVFAFSHDPSFDGDPWKNNWHTSDNAGVGDYAGGSSADGDIQTRYKAEALGYGAYWVVGKPVSLWGGSPWVERHNAPYLWTGVMQTFLSPNATYGYSIIAHGDGVPAVGGSAAFSVYGDIYQEYLGSCDDQGWVGPFFNLIGYPLGERQSLNCGYNVDQVQEFQNGYVYKFCSNGTPSPSGVMMVAFKSSQKLCDADVHAQGVTPTPTNTPRPTRTPTRIPTKTPTPAFTPTPTNTYAPTPTATITPTPTNTCTPAPTATVTPTPTFTPTPTITPNIDTDGDGVLDHLDNCPFVPNPDQLNTDAKPFDIDPIFPGQNVTVPNSDKLGDACDPDIDNDWMLNTGTNTFGIPGEDVGCGSRPTNPN